MHGSPFSGCLNLQILNSLLIKYYAQPFIAKITTSKISQIITMDWLNNRQISSTDLFKAISVPKLVYCQNKGKTKVFFKKIHKEDTLK
ncbi:hypothetical protein ATZ33_13410 [Enterococcus silesiacus]|uniref:Transposase n=1 Tax=Enterococcus silesiacus TaxID=332949 RepID=A0ABM5WB35_9ENTE|nr:hypothetical protein ATZ33_13410 [Enterococcus silesiacus]